MSTTQSVARQALADLATSSEVADLLKRLQQVQRETEQDDTWNTPLGRKVESAMGYLQMAIEAADPLAFQR